jgi:hypothetical protein
MYNREMECYRLQHKETKLGPYEHGGQIYEVVTKGIDCGVFDEGLNIFFEEVIDKNLKAKFAFTSLEELNKFIKDWDVLNKYDFEIARLNVEPLLIGGNQVIFNF